MPGEYFYVQSPKTNALRLSFATTPPDKIRAAIQVLGRLIAQRMVSASSVGWQCEPVTK